MHTHTHHKTVKQKYDSRFFFSSVCLPLIPASGIIFTGITICLLCSNPIMGPKYPGSDPSPHPPATPLLHSLPLQSIFITMPRSPDTTLPLFSLAETHRMWYTVGRRTMGVIVFFGRYWGMNATRSGGGGGAVTVVVRRSEVLRKVMG